MTTTINKSTRLTETDYTGPSIQQKLSDQEIKELMEQYTRINDINTIPLYSNIRYFSLKDKEGNPCRLFRFGGILTKKDTEKGYIVLANTLQNSNGRKRTWCVQLNAAELYRKKTAKDIVDEFIEPYNEVIKQLINNQKILENEINKKNIILKKLIDEVNKLKYMKKN